MFKIDNDIPAPTPYRKGYTKALRGLKVDESVFFPSSIASIHSLIRQLYTSGFAKQGAFTARTERQENAIGTRVWRLW